MIRAEPVVDIQIRIRARVLHSKHWYVEPVSIHSRVVDGTREGYIEGRNGRLVGSRSEVVQWPGDERRAFVGGHREDYGLAREVAGCGLGRVVGEDDGVVGDVVEE